MGYTGIDFFLKKCVFNFFLMVYNGNFYGVEWDCLWDIMGNG
jgi:hypothetical protein